MESVTSNMGSGPLTLGIFCCKCSAQFDLNKEGVAAAILFDSSFIEYLKFVQSSKCPKCGVGGSV